MKWIQAVMVASFVGAGALQAQSQIAPYEEVVLKTEAFVVFSQALDPETDEIVVKPLLFTMDPTKRGARTFWLRQMRANGLDRSWPYWRRRGFYVGRAAVETSLWPPQYAIPPPWPSAGGGEGSP